MKPYILIFNSEFGNQTEISEFLTQEGMKCTTVNGFTNCLFILSDIDDVNQLSNLLRNKFKFGRHVVFSADKRQGWMPTTLWKFYKGQTT